MAAEGDFYSTRFYLAVEAAFLPLEDEGLDYETATREKRRVREKLRRAGQALRVREGGSQAELDLVLQGLYRGALERLSASAWWGRVDMVSIVAVLACEAWPGLGTEEEVRAAAKGAMEACQACGDSPRGEAEPELKAKAAAEGAPCPARGDSPRGEAERELEARAAAESAPVECPRAPPAGSGSVAQWLRGAALEQWLAPPAGPAASEEADGAAAGGPLAACGGSRPSRPAGAARIGARAEDVRLVSVRLDRRGGEKLGLSMHSLVVQEVKPDGLGVGLFSKGDRIEEVNGRKVRSQSEFTEVLSETRGPVLIKVLPQPVLTVDPMPPSCRTGPVPLGRPPAGQRGPPPPPPARRPEGLGQPSTPCAVDEGCASPSWLEPRDQRRRGAADPGHARSSDRDAAGGGRRPAERPRGPPPSAADTLAARPRAAASAGAARAGASGLVAPPRKSPVVVINCEDVGRHRGRNFDWDAVRRAIEHYEEAGYEPQGVCGQATLRCNPPPSTIEDRIVPCPVIDECRFSQGPTSARVFVLRLSQAYGCCFVDNSNYRLRVWEEHSAYEWLLERGHGLKISYIFDVFGNYIPASTPESCSS